MAPPGYQRSSYDTDEEQTTLYNGDQPDEWESGYDWDDEEPVRTPYLLVAFTSAVVSAVTVVALFLVMETVTSGGQATVPALVGMNLTQARAAAQAARLVVTVAGQVEDPVIEKGRIARQVPLAGGQARPGQTVAVTLSRGSGQVNLESLAGLTLAAARARLKALGLVAGQVTYQAHAAVAAGQVISSTPAAGAVLSASARVALAVSSGAASPATGTPAAGAAPPALPTAPTTAPTAAPKKAPGNSLLTVPKVTGIRLKFARSRLTSRGLLVGKVIHEMDEDHMDNYVLRQIPRAGTPAAKGDKVDLVINRVE